MKEQRFRFVLFFFLGFIWHEIKQAYNDGFQDYLLSWNNIVDSCMSILYLSSFALKYYVIGKVSVFFVGIFEQFREIILGEYFDEKIG
jgi:hypothetical protein